MKTKEELQGFLGKAIKLAQLSERQRSETEIRVYSVAQGMIVATTFALGDIQDEVDEMIDEMDLAISTMKH